MTATARCETTGKTGFATETAAKKRRRRGMGGQRLRVYRCGFCQRWHFTSRPRRETP